MVLASRRGGLARSIPPHSVGSASDNPPLSLRSITSSVVSLVIIGLSIGPKMRITGYSGAARRLPLAYFTWTAILSTSVPTPQGMGQGIGQPVGLFPGPSAGELVP